MPANQEPPLALTAISAQRAYTVPTHRIASTEQPTTTRPGVIIGPITTCRATINTTTGRCKQNPLINFFLATWIGNVLAFIGTLVAIIGLTWSIYSGVVGLLRDKWAVHNDAVEACAALYSIDMFSDYCNKTLNAGVTSPPVFRRSSYESRKKPGHWPLDLPSLCLTTAVFITVSALVISVVYTRPRMNVFQPTVSAVRLDPIKRVYGSIIKLERFHQQGPRKFNLQVNLILEEIDSIGRLLSLQYVRTSMPVGPNVQVNDDCLVEKDSVYAHSEASIRTDSDEMLPKVLVMETNLQRSAALSIVRESGDDTQNEASPSKVYAASVLGYYSGLDLFPVPDELLELPKLRDYQTLLKHYTSLTESRFEIVVPWHVFEHLTLTELSLPQFLELCRDIHERVEHQEHKSPFDTFLPSDSPFEIFRYRFGQGKRVLSSLAADEFRSLTRHVLEEITFRILKLKPLEDESPQTPTEDYSSTYSWLNEVEPCDLIDDNGSMGSWSDEVEEPDSDADAENPTIKYVHMR